MKPGATMQFEASRTRASPAEIPAASFAMRPLSMRTSRRASVFETGSRTRPFLMSSMRRFLWLFLRLGGAGNQFEKNGHAHGEAVGDLLENAGLQAVGDSGIDFEAANHRAGMQN